MSSQWDIWLERWMQAGLLDAAAAERIRAFEAARDEPRSRRLRWPIVIALAFGSLMVAGGILLFVAANWDALSPASRFALVILLVAIFHVAGAVSAGRIPGMSEALHAVGTVALGAGIALSGQIFNLDEHWPAGILLWAIGAGLGWGILRHTAQFALVALLIPAWLISEWAAAAAGAVFLDDASPVVAAGALLLAFSYFTAPSAARRTRQHSTLMWIGGIGLPIAATALAALGLGRYDSHLSQTREWVLGWTVVFAAPLAVTMLMRANVASTAAAAVWVAALVFLPGLSGSVLAFGWWALGAIGLVASGVSSGRVERINLGSAAFAATVLAFYFSRVMDKLGRSAFLLILGLLFLGGGWALDRMRRQLVARSRENR
jgi:hypothetical protein